MIPEMLTPGLVTTFRCWWKFRCYVSPRAEIEVSKLLMIGEKTRISSFAKIKARHGPLKIGSHVGIGVGCAIAPGEKGLTIGDYCLLGPHCVVTSSNHRWDRLDVPVAEQGLVSKGIEIGRNVWIGGGCQILDGTTIGDNVIVASGSVVSGHIPENVVIQGNPAKEVFRRR